MNAAELEYHRLTGYLVGTFTVERRDRRRGCIIQTEYEVINLGRADRGITVDPDVLLEEEKLEGEEQMDSYHQTIAAKAEQRHDVAKEILIAYLQKYGPQPTRALTGLTEWKGRKSLVDHLGRFPDTYIRVCENPLMWGLPGQTWAAERQVSAGEWRLVEVLKEHGPLLISEARLLANVPLKSAQTAMVRHEGFLFVRVGEKRTNGGNSGTVWGVAGVHDKEGA